MDRLSSRQSNEEIVLISSCMSSSHVDELRQETLHHFNNNFILQPVVNEMFINKTFALINARIAEDLYSIANHLRVNINKLNFCDHFKIVQWII